MDEGAVEPRPTDNRVILVHHNALLREGICRILEEADFRVVWQGGDGEASAAQIADHSPDVILLEWEAPGANTGLVEELAASPVDAPIVIISRPDTEDDLTHVLEAGAAGCLSVNLATHDFLSALKLLLEGHILVSQEMVPAVTHLPADEEDPLARLTPREMEILRALGRGATNQEIADELFISPHTVKIHVRRILAKLEFRNRQQAAAYAAAEGLL